MIHKQNSPPSSKKKPHVEVVLSPDKSVAFVVSLESTKKHPELVMARAIEGLSVRKISVNLAATNTVYSKPTGLLVFYFYFWM